jgi:toxin YhaV
MDEEEDDSFGEVNGWKLYPHPLFLKQVEKLFSTVEELKAKKPRDYQKSTSAKHLAAIFKLVFEAIPADPANPIFNQGNTLGSDYRKWKRGKFFQQYRLFFQYEAGTKTIVYAWVNDEDTKRAYDKKSDAYSVFKGMLDCGNPPADFDSLLSEAKEASEGMKKVVIKLNSNP